MSDHRFPRTVIIPYGEVVKATLQRLGYPVELAESQIHHTNGFWKDYASSLQELVGTDVESTYRCLRTVTRTLASARAYCLKPQGPEKVRFKQNWREAMWSIYGTGHKCWLSRTAKRRSRFQRELVRAGRADDSAGRIGKGVNVNQLVAGGRLPLDRRRHPDRFRRSSAVPRRARAEVADLAGRRIVSTLVPASVLRLARRDPAFREQTTAWRFRIIGEFDYFAASALCIGVPFTAVIAIASVWDGSLSLAILATLVGGATGISYGDARAEGDQLRRELAEIERFTGGVP